MHPGRDADTAGFGQCFQPPDIDSVAEGFGVLDHNAALVDVDPPSDRAVSRHCGLPCRCASERNDDALELGEHPVARGLDYAGSMLGDSRIDHLAPHRPERGERGFLVLPD